MEFIFENPIFILVIIIGVIKSLYSKLKVSTPANPSQKPEWEKRMEIPQTFNNNQQEMTRSEKEQQNKSKLAQEYYNIKKTNESSQPKETHKSNIGEVTSYNQNKHLHRGTLKDEIGGDNELTLRNENVTEGIIWAEILGPPRAVRSHSQRRALHRR